MTHSICLTTRDGHTLSFDCSPGQSLIEAAMAASIILPAQCQQGSCGACHADVKSGDYVMSQHNPEVLPAGNADGILMCCTTPRSDLSIALPYDRARILFHAIKQRRANIVALEGIAANTVRLELRLVPDEDGSAAEFEPGQYMELGIPGTEEYRAYSLANTPNWDGSLEFFIRLHAQGWFSTFLSEHAQPGMMLNVRGPVGAFGLKEDSMRPRWFVVGGTGIAPCLAMLRRMAEFQDMREARLFFGATQESELFALDELWRLRSELPQLTVDVCVWKPSGNWHGFTGTPAEALREALASTITQPDLYLCGPVSLIDSAEDIAAAAGLGSERVFSERFPPRQALLLL